MPRQLKLYNFKKIGNSLIVEFKDEKGKPDNAQAKFAWHNLQKNRGFGTEDGFTVSKEGAKVTIIRKGGKPCTEADLERARGNKRKKAPEPVNYGVFELQEDGTIQGKWVNAEDKPDYAQASKAADGVKRYRGFRTADDFTVTQTGNMVTITRKGGKPCTEADLERARGNKRKKAPEPVNYGVFKQQGNSIRGLFKDADEAKRARRGLINYRDFRTEDDFIVTQRGNTITIARKGGKPCTEADLDRARGDIKIKAAAPVNYEAFEQRGDSIQGKWFDAEGNPDHAQARRAADGVKRKGFRKKDGFTVRQKSNTVTITKEIEDKKCTEADLDRARGDIKPTNRRKSLASDLPPKRVKADIDAEDVYEFIQGTKGCRRADIISVTIDDDTVMVVTNQELMTTEGYIEKKEDPLSSVGAGAHTGFNHTYTFTPAGIAALRAYGVPIEVVEPALHTRAAAPESVPVAFSVPMHVDAVPPQDSNAALEDVLLEGWNRTEGVKGLVEPSGATVMAPAGAPMEITPSERPPYRLPSDFMSIDVGTQSVPMDVSLVAPVAVSVPVPSTGLMTETSDPMSLAAPYTSMDLVGKGARSTSKVPKPPPVPAGAVPAPLPLPVSFDRSSDTNLMGASVSNILPSANREIVPRVVTDPMSVDGLDVDLTLGDNELENLLLGEGDTVEEILKMMEKDMEMVTGPGGGRII